MPRCWPILLALPLAALPWSPAAAQGEPDSAHALSVDPSVRHGVLPNGFSYYLKRNDYPEKRAELRLVVAAGSILEDDDQRGLAHVLEHLAFSGTPHFPKRELMQYLQQVGMRAGSDVNASTSYDETIYDLTVPTHRSETFEQALTIIEDWAHRLTLDPAELERERKVVLEEWRLRRGAGRRIGERHTAVLLQGSRYPDRSPIGEISVLRSAPIDAVRRFYADWYRPDLMALVVVGDIDPAALESRVRTQFGAVPAPSSPRQRQRFSVPAHPSTRVSIVADSEATATTVSVAYKRPWRPVRTVGDFRLRLVRGLHDAMLNARLAERTLEPSAPFRAAGVGEDTPAWGTVALRLAAEVPDSAVLAGLEGVLQEMDRVGASGFTASELDRQKTVVLRGYEQREAQRSNITSAAFAAGLVSGYLYGVPSVSVEDEIALARRLLPGITLEEVSRSGVDRMEGASRVVMVSAPGSAERLLPADSMLVGVLERRHAVLAAYVDTTISAPLLAREPVGGKVVQATAADSLGIHRWVLSNGLRILLKPTTFNPDEVMLTSYRDGGTSVASDGELIPAATAASLVCGSGVGRLDAVALSRRLAGKAVRVSCDISEHGEGLSGGASPRDLEALLQLIYLQFTEPRLDPRVSQRYRAELSAALLHRDADPGTAYSDTLAMLLTNHHPRARLLDSTYVEALDPEKSLAFFRDRFADAGGFTFVLVGAFEPDSIRPLVERYLGGLPTTGRASRWRDHGIRPSPGVVQRLIRKGREPKASTTLIFHGSATPTQVEDRALAVLTSVLRHRLEQRLRQDLGGVYGVSVDADLSTVPEGAFQIQLAFGADPARLDELTRATFAEITRLQRDGPTAREVETVREEYRRMVEIVRRTNGYWVSAIARHDSWQWPMSPGITDRLMETMSPRRVREAARRYLDRANHLQVSLLPEGSPP
jgi:zinc protease